MTTKETLFATRRDATPAQKMDLRLDVEVPAGTQLLKCHKMDDRWLITVNLDGKKMQLVTYRDPLGKTTEGKTGPKFALHMPVRVKRAQCGLPKGTIGKVHGYAALQTCAVWVDGKTHLIGEEFLTPHKPKTAVKKGAVEHGVSQRRRQTVSDG